MRVDVFFDKAARFFVDPVNPKNQHPKLAVAATSILGVLTVGLVQGLSFLWRSLRPVKEKNETLKRATRLFHKAHPKAVDKSNPQIKDAQPGNDAAKGSSSAATGRSQQVHLNSDEAEASKPSPPSPSTSQGAAGTVQNHTVSSYPSLPLLPGASSQASSAPSSGSGTMPQRGTTSKSAPVHPSTSQRAQQNAATSSSVKSAPMLTHPDLTEKNLKKLKDYVQTLTDNSFFVGGEVPYIVSYDSITHTINIQNWLDFNGGGENSKIGFELDSQGRLMGLRVNGSQQAQSLSAIPNQFQSALVLAVQKALFETEIFGSWTTPPPSSDSPPVGGIQNDAETPLPPELTEENLQKLKDYVQTLTNNYFFVDGEIPHSISYDPITNVIDIKDWIGEGEDDRIVFELDSQGRLVYLRVNGSEQSPILSAIPKEFHAVLVLAIQKAQSEAGVSGSGPSLGSPPLPPLPSFPATSSTHAVSIPNPSPGGLTGKNLLALQEYLKSEELFIGEDPLYTVYYDPAQQEINIQNCVNYNQGDTSNWVRFTLDSEGDLASLHVNEVARFAKLETIPDEFRDVLAEAILLFVPGVEESSPPQFVPQPKTEFNARLVRLKEYFMKLGEPFFIPKATHAFNKYAVSWDAINQTILIQKEADYIAGNNKNITKIGIGPNGEFVQFDNGKTRLWATITLEGKITISLDLSIIPTAEQAPLSEVLKEMELLEKGEGRCAARGLTSENAAKIYDYFCTTQKHFDELEIPFIIQTPDSTEYEVKFDSHQSELILTKRVASSDGTHEKMIFTFDKKVPSIKVQGKPERGIQSMARLSEIQHDALAAVLREVLWEEGLAYNLLAFQVVLDEYKKKTATKQVQPVVLRRGAVLSDSSDESEDSGQKSETRIPYIPLKHGLPEEPASKADRKKYIVGWFAKESVGVKAINFQNHEEYESKSSKNKIGIHFKKDGSIASIWIDDQDSKSTKIPFEFYPIIRAGLRKAFKESSVYTLRNDQKIKVHVLAPGLSEVPEYHLSQLNQIIAKRIAAGCDKPEITVQFLRSNLELTLGTDGGGLRREYFDSLTQGIADSRELSFAKTREGKIPRTTLSQEFAIFPEVTEGEKGIYYNLGKLMMFCYRSEEGWSTEKYTLGQHFNPLIFKAILCLAGDEVSKSFAELSMETKLKMCAALVDEGDKYSNTLLALLTDGVETASDKALKTAAEMIQGTNCLSSQFINDDEAPDLDKIKLDMNSFRQNAERALFAPPDKPVSLGRQLAPIHAIAQGMYDYSQLVNTNWTALCNKPYLKVSIEIQGMLDRDIIVGAISGCENDKEISKKVGWLKEWLKDESTTEDELRFFLKYVGGATGIRSGDNIKIASQATNDENEFQGTRIYNPIPGSHTCFWQLDFAPEPCGNEVCNDKTKESFIECIKLAIQPTKTVTFTAS